MTNPQSEQAQIEEYITEQKQDYLQNPEFKEDAIELLNFFSAHGRLEDFAEFFNTFSSNHATTKEMAEKWLENLSALETSPQTLQVIIQFIIDACSKNYLPSIACEIFEFLMISIKGGELEYKDAKVKIEDILKIYESDYFYGARLFEGYQEIITTCSSIKEGMLKKAIQSLMKRRLSFLLKDFEINFEEFSKINPDLSTIELLKKVDDLKFEQNELLELIRYLEDQDQKEKDDLIDEFTRMMLTKKSQGILCSFFEKIVDRFPNSSKIWEKMITLAQSGDLRSQEQVRFYIFRAARAFPLNLGFQLSYLRLESETQEAMEAAYQNINLRLSKEGKPILYKIWSTYFRMTLHHIIKGCKGSNEAAIDSQEGLGDLVDYFELILEQDKKIGFQGKFAISEIYKDYIQYLYDLKTDEFDDIIEAKCEKNVQISGNLPENWIFYIDFLRRQNAAENIEKIQRIFKRGITFCGGDVNKIYEYYRSYYETYTSPDLSKLEKEYLQSIQSKKNYSDLIKKL